MEIKKDFPLLISSDICYLDSAATSQKPQYVIDKIAEFYKSQNANVHRGAYSLSINATEEYENSRKKISQFINSRYSEEIIFTKNASEALNLVAYSYGLSTLKKGDEIVISIMEHHSNLVIWQKIAALTGAKLKYMYINNDYTLDDNEIESKITDKTKIVGITHVSNVLGTINDVEKIIKYSHSKGAKVLVDASQSIMHMKIDVQKLDVDFLAFSGHKMLAPLGIGVLYGKREILNEMPPFLMGGDMIEYVYEDKTTYAPLPNKFEAGTQNIEGVIGLKAAIEYIEKIGYEAIQKKEKELSKYLLERLRNLDYVTVYATQDETKHSAVVSFNINGVHPHDVASVLDSYHVCVRSGNHCCQPLMRYLKIDSTCRASIGIYTSKEDIDKLIFAIEKAYKMFEKYIAKKG